MGPPGGSAPRAALVGNMATELTTVADDEVVFHDDDGVHRFDGLEPDSEYTLLNTPVRTLRIQEVAPGVAVEGPFPEFAEQLRDLHRRFHAKTKAAKP